MKTAKIISYLFVPPVMNVALFTFLAFKFGRASNTAFWEIISTILFGFVLPVIVFVYLRRKGRIANDDATVKEERTLPYIIGIVFCLMAGYITYTSDSTETVYMMWLFYAANSVVLLVINHFWKISAHLLGASMPFAGIFFFSSSAVFIFIPLLLVIGWARWKLQVHTISQIIAGAVVGFGLTYVELAWFLG